MRVCLKHMEKAVMTLTDNKEGAEYDLCLKCKDNFIKLMVQDPVPTEEEIRNLANIQINEENKPKVEVKRGRKRAT